MANAGLDKPPSSSMGGTDHFHSLGRRFLSQYFGHSIVNNLDLTSVQSHINTFYFETEPRILVN